MSIDWGKIVTGGFEIVKEAITGPRLSGPPVPPASQGSTGSSSGVVTWVIVAAVALVLFGKKLKRLFK